MATDEYNPTDGMSMGEKVLAGMGWAFVQGGRVVGNMVGLVSDAEMAEAAKLDAPLLKTTEGKVGAVLGTTAGAVGVAAIGTASAIAAGPTVVAGTVQATTMLWQAAPSIVSAYYAVEGVKEVQKELNTAGLAGNTLANRTEPRSSQYDPRIPPDTTCGDLRPYRGDVDPQNTALSATGTVTAAWAQHAVRLVPYGNYVAPVLSAAQWTGQMVTGSLVAMDLAEVAARDAGKAVCTYSLEETRERIAGEKEKLAAQQRMAQTPPARTPAPN